MTMMKGQNSVPFVKLGMWDGAFYHSLVVTKHVALVMDGDSKVPESALKIQCRSGQPQT